MKVVAVEPGGDPLTEFGANIFWQEHLHLSLQPVWIIPVEVAGDFAGIEQISVFRDPNWLPEVL